MVGYGFLETGLPYRVCRFNTHGVSVNGPLVVVTHQLQSHRVFVGFWTPGGISEHLRVCRRGNQWWIACGGSTCSPLCPFFFVGTGVGCRRPPAGTVVRGVAAAMQALIRAATEKLALASVITVDADEQAAELSRSVGDEISRVILEQRQLEQRFEALISQRGVLKAMPNKTKYKENQKELHEVADQLRNSTKVNPPPAADEGGNPLGVACGCERGRGPNVS